MMYAIRWFWRDPGLCRVLYDRAGGAAVLVVDSVYRSAVRLLSKWGVEVVECVVDGQEGGRYRF